MEEFSNAIGWKIFYCALAIGMILFSAVIATADRSQSIDLILVIPAAMSLFALLILASQLKNKIIISAESIKRVTVFGTKEIATADINGCRISDKNIIIEPISPSGTKITLNSYSDLANSEDLVSWLTSNFKDLDSLDLKEQQDQILHDTSLGFTEQEREEKLKRAKQVALVYNIAGGVLGVAVLFTKATYFLIISTIIFPLLGIAIMKFSNGLIKFLTNRKRSVYPAIFLGFYLSALMAFIPAIAGYDLLDYSNVLVPCAVVTVIIASLLYFAGINRAAEAVKGQVIFMFALAVLYSYGSSVNLNCGFDKSIPQKFTATVLNHEVRHGKSTTYYLTLSAWGPQKKNKNISVGSKFYYATSIGTTVNIYLKKGVLNIPWFWISH